MKEPYLPKCSIIISTYNRAHILGKALRTVQNQTYPADRYEIIVVDNNSTDKTRAVVESINHNRGNNVRYFFEERRGMHWARHAGAAAAAGEILAYTDDDVLVDPDWLAELVSVYRDPTVYAAGGKIKVKWDGIPPPDWARRLYESRMGHLDYGGDKPLELQFPQHIAGASFSIRRDVLFKIGGFNPDNAPADPLVGDGECGLCYKVYAKHGKLMFVPKAFLWHVVSAKDANLTNLKRRARLGGMSSAYGFVHNHIPGCVDLWERVIKYLLYFGKYKAISFMALLLRRGLTFYRCELKANSYWGYAIYLARIGTDAKLRLRVQRSDWINEFFSPDLDKQKSRR